MPLGERGHGTLRRLMRRSVFIRSRRPRGVRHSSTDKNRAAKNTTSSIRISLTPRGTRSLEADALQFRDQRVAILDRSQSHR